MDEKPSQKDLLDAIDHASDFSNEPLSLEDFNLEFLGDLSVDDLRQYDDVDAWLDLRPDTFQGMSDEEKVAELGQFRGPKWGVMAAKWLKAGKIPPIVVITTPEMTQIGDGRGRVNVASGFGLKVPTWHLVYKGMQEQKMKKSDLVKLIQESVAKALKEYDRGDIEIRNSVKLDQAVKEADQLLESLKALVKAMQRKQDLNMLAAFNQSLGGFVQKVANAVRSGKVQ
jgi:hypothetical protein